MAAVQLNREALLDTGHPLAVVALHGNHVVLPCAVAEAEDEIVLAVGLRPAAVLHVEGDDIVGGGGEGGQGHAREEVPVAQAVGAVLGEEILVLQPIAGVTMEACEGGVATLEGLDGGQSVAEVVVVGVDEAVMLHLDGGGSVLPELIEGPGGAEGIVVVDLGVVVTAHGIVLYAEAALVGVIQDLLHLGLTVGDAAGHMVVVAQHPGVGEILGVEVKMLLDHGGGDDLTRTAGGMTLAPGTHGAHVDALDEGMAVELFAQGVQESLHVMEEDGVAVVGLDAAAGEAIALGALLVDVGGGGVVHIGIVLIGADPEGELIAAGGPLLHDLIQVGEIVHALGLLYVAPVKAEVEVVEAGEIGQVVVMVVVDTVVLAAVAVVDVVPEPALVGVLQGGLIVHQGTKIHEVGADGPIIEHAAEGLGTAGDGGRLEIGILLFHGSIRSFPVRRFGRWCVRWCRSRPQGRFP